MGVLREMETGEQFTCGGGVEGVGGGETEGGKEASSCAGEVAGGEKDAGEGG